MTALNGWGLYKWGAGLATGAAPVLQNVSPASGGTIDSDDAVSFEVYAANGLDTLAVFAEYPSLAMGESVYLADALAPNFRNSASAVSAITNGQSFTVLRTGGWPDTSVRLRVVATDLAGQALAGAVSWTVAFPVVVTPPATAPKKSKHLNPLGLGVVRPFRRSPAGDFVNGEGPSLVLSNVGQIIGTIPGELRWRPSFGTNLATLRHRTDARGLSDLARVLMQGTVARWEPRANVVDAEVEPVVIGGENRIAISVSVQIGNGTVEEGVVVL